MAADVNSSWLYQNENLDCSNFVNVNNPIRDIKLKLKSCKILNIINLHVQENQGYIYKHFYFLKYFWDLSIGFIAMIIKIIIIKWSLFHTII
jgi:hypothetical protein